MAATEHVLPTSPPKGEKIASGALYSFGSMVAMRIVTALNSIIIIRSLSVQDFGVYSIVLLTVSVAGIVSSFGIPSALVKFLAEGSASDPDESSQVLGGGLVVVLVTTALTSLSLFLLSPFLGTSLYGQPQISVLLVLATAGLVVTSVASPLLATFQGLEFIKELGTVNVVAAVVSLPVTFVLVTYAGLWGAVLAGVVTATLGVIVYVPWLRRAWTRRDLTIMLPRRFQIYRRLLGYSVPALAGSFLVAPILWFSTTLLATRGSFSVVGLYSVGDGLAEYLLYITSAIGMPLVPMVSRLERHQPVEYPAFLTKTLRVGTFLLLTPTLVLVAFPEPFLELLFGGEYLAATPVVRYMAVAVFMAGVSNIVGFGIAGTGRMWDGLFLNLIWALTLGVAAWLLIPPLGALGLAYAMLVAYGVHAVTALGYAEWRWSIDMRGLAPPFMLAAASLVMAELLSPEALSLRLILGGILVVAVLGISIRWMSRRELEVLLEPLRRFMLWTGLFH